MDLSKFKDGRVHLINSGVKGLRTTSYMVLPIFYRLYTYIAKHNDHIINVIRPVKNEF